MLSFSLSATTLAGFNPLHVKPSKILPTKPCQTPVLFGKNSSQYRRSEHYPKSQYTSQQRQELRAKYLTQTGMFAERKLLLDKLLDLTDTNFAEALLMTKNEAIAWLEKQNSWQKVSQNKTENNKSAVFIHRRTKIKIVVDTHHTGIPQDHFDILNFGYLGTPNCIKLRLAYNHPPKLSSGALLRRKIRTFA